MKKLFCFLALFSLLGIAAWAQNERESWVGTWAASPTAEEVNPGQPGPGNSTYRSVVHISRGGDVLRVHFTNEFGTRPLSIGSAHIAVSAGGGSIRKETDQILMFGGRPTVIVPGGAMVLSDPIKMDATPLSDLVVSVYLPDQRINSTTCHIFGASTNYVFRGDATAAPTTEKAVHIFSWCFVNGIDVGVKARENARAVVAFGDSITDGASSTRDANRRWPDVLAARLQADKKSASLGVLNEGIGGNRILHDNVGQSALARLDRDVIAQSGVKYLILLAGINDIGRVEPGEPIAAQDLIFGLSQLVMRAHQHGIKVYGATLTPFMGTGYSSPAGEEIRQAENLWIRTSGVFDAVIDFDKTTRDPANPSMFLPEYDSGDHLHPNDAGYKAMGDSVDLSLFDPK